MSIASAEKTLPEVSVVIPTFRRPKELRRAIQSVLSQDYQNFEVIVVDDDLRPGDDLIEQTIKDFKDNRIKYIENQRTPGANGARNTGTVLATGKYVAYLDDDDEWYPHKLSEQVGKLERLDHQWGGVYSGHDLIRGDVIVSICSEIEGSVQEEYLLRKFTVGASSTLLFRKEALVHVGLWNEPLARRQDIELVIRFLRFYKLAVIAHPLVRVHGHNDPSPEKRVGANSQLNELIFDDIKKLSFFKKNLFYALQYQEIGRCFALEGHPWKALKYAFLSFFFGNLDIVSHAKIWFYISRNILKAIHLDYLLKEEMFLNKHTSKNFQAKKENGE